MSNGSNPSHVAVLSQQLLSELAALAEPSKSGGTSPDPWRFRALLRQIHAQAWASVARHDFSVLRELLGSIVEAEEIVRPALPDCGPPSVEAAREVHFMAYSLHVAEAAVRSMETKANLGERHRSAFERKVLRVLVKNRDRYLRRAEILEAMQQLLPLPYPDPSRVSQILSALHDERLLLRVRSKAQGNRHTSFFMLSRQGLELCRALQLIEPSPLFEPEEGKWRHLLRPSRLAVTPNESQNGRRIAAFYRPRPGVGCSLAVVNCSILLAKKVQKLDPPVVLVLNLDGEESTLKDIFGAEARGHMGLAGLLDGYNAQPKEARASWLEEAIFESDSFACRPMGALSNLLYLPAFQEKPEADSFHLYSELMSDLRHEIESQPQREDGAPRLASSGFLGHLRGLLMERCARTVIQAPSALGPGAYAATVLLAEELILFLHPNDAYREGVRRTVRELVGNCLWRGEEDTECGPQLTFVFSPIPLTAKPDLPKQVERLLVTSGLEDDESVYRIIRLYLDARLIIGSAQVHGSLLATGHEELVETLRPNSSLGATHWKRKENMMERMSELFQFVGAELSEASGVSVTPSDPALTLAARYLELQEKTSSRPQEPQAFFRHQEDLKPLLAELAATTEQ